MVDCTESKKRYRQDHVEVLTVEGKGRWGFPENNIDYIAKKLKKAGVSRDDGTVLNLTEIPFEEYAQIIGPDTDKPGTFTEPREFNLMFQTYVGALATEDNLAYLRPETAQGIFLNYKNVVDTMRVKVPFGIAQIGKSFRNEVTPRNFIFRSREFEQMEMEWFCPPNEAKQWLDFWKAERMKWWESLGVLCGRGIQVSLHRARLRRTRGRRPPRLLRPLGPPGTLQGQDGILRSGPPSQTPE